MMNLPNQLYRLSLQTPDDEDIRTPIGGVAFFDFFAEVSEDDVLWDSSRTVTTEKSVGRVWMAREDVEKLRDSLNAVLGEEYSNP